MIDDTLDLSRIEAGSLRVELSQLALAPLVALGTGDGARYGAGAACGLKLEPGSQRRLRPCRPDAPGPDPDQPASNAIKYKRKRPGWSWEAEGREPGW